MTGTPTGTDIVETLLACAAFETPDDIKQPLLLRAVLEQARFHYAHSPAYRRFCEQRGFDPNSGVDRLDQIPPLPVQAFKELGSTLASVAATDIQVQLQSSATTGTPSTVVLDRQTARHQARALGQVMGAVLGGRRLPFWIFDAAPNAATSHLSARGAAIRGFLSVASKADYLLESAADGGLQLSIDHIEQLANSAVAAGTPICVFGFTYVLYADVVKRLQAASRSIKLPAGSKVLHIGGWKKLARLGVTTAEFSRAVAAVFGIDPRDVVDIYGFTEQIGLVYPTCAAGHKHAPAYSEIVVRNPLSMAPEPDGQAGVIEFVTPIPHSYPGVAVVTDDQGRIVGRGRCECGWFGTRFEVLGRLQHAELRGCGDVIADLVSPSLERQPAQSTGPIELLFRRATRVEQIVQAESIGDIVTELREAQRRLAQLPVDDIIAVIGAAALRWEARDHPLAHLRQHGLSFMAGWCRPDRLTRMVDASFGGSRAVLDSFRPDPVAPKRQIRAVARGVAAHWLAGNAPTLGMLSVLGCLLTKNASLVKVPSGAPGVLPILLQDLAEVSARSAGGRTIQGADIANAIAVVKFGREHQRAAARVAEHADLRIAWGGAEAVRAITSLPKRVGCEELVFGPKLSLMVIGRDALSDDNAVAKLVRHAALDCSAFEQYACSSPHTVFVERGGAITPQEFARLLSAAMGDALARLPKAAIDGAVMGRAQSARMKHLATGDFYGPQGLEWSVLYDETGSLAEPVYYRTIFVRAIDDVMAVPGLLSPANQTVGLALTGVRRSAFLEAAAAAGVDRFPTVGHMTDYDAPWDGLWSLTRMVRFVSTGPPL